MILFLKLFLAHLLGDFFLQPEKWVKDKEKNKIKSSKLYFHILIHFVLLLIFLQFDITKYWLIITIITISHYSLDVLKIYLQDKKSKRVWFFIDQLLHVFLLLITSYLCTNSSFSFNDFFTDKILLLLVAVVLVTYVSAITIKVIITQWNPESKKENDDSLAKAGRYIGILERLFVFVFVVTNHWEAIGFLLAAKSVFRFGDLTESKDRKLTEYILIGTLLSFGLAILIGVLYLFILNTL